MDNTEYIGFIPFTYDQPCEIAVGILCLKDCKTLHTESIFTQLMTKRDMVANSCHEGICKSREVIAM